MRAFAWLLLACSPLVAVSDTGLSAARGEPRIERDVVFGHKLGMALTYDVVHPAEPNGAGVVFLVSSGWYSRWFAPEEAVDERRESAVARLWRAGFTVFLLRHGSSPCFAVPDAVADVRAGLRDIRWRAAQFGVDRERLGAFGLSAGGHLALMLGTIGEDAGEGDGLADAGTRVAAVAAWFPPTDLVAMVGPSDLFPALDFDPELAPAVSPLLQVTPDDAPTLLVHGAADRLVDVSHSRRMQAALEREGVPNRLMVLEGAGHGFGGAERRRAADAVVTWFELYLLD